MPGRCSRFCRPTTFTTLTCGAALFVTGCGHSPPEPRSAATRSELAWIDNATGLVSQLGDAVVVTASGGSDLATARLALDDQSDLLAMVMANVAFGSCAESVRNVGVASDRLEDIKTTLVSACRLLQQASRFFTTAMTRSDPRSLLLAAHVSERASSLLREAKAALDAIRAELTHRATP